MSYSSIKTSDHITVVNSETGESGTVNSDHKSYEVALESLRAGDYDGFMLIANPASVVHTVGEGRIVIEDGVVNFDGEELHGVLADKMIDSIHDGFGIEPLAAFLINLHTNPSMTAIEELYGFLEASDLTITVDGHFVAYKRVRDDYMDCYSGTFDNHPGETCEMDRNKVDDNKNIVCSKGLHFCGREYLKVFGAGRTVIVKVNPRDVVSIPTDYHNHKGRCCKYVVIGELDNGRDELGEENAQALEGSVFTGDGMDMHDDADSMFIAHYFPTRTEARDFARGKDNKKFHDNGPDAPEGERWAVHNV